MERRYSKHLRAVAVLSTILGWAGVANASGVLVDDAGLPVLLITTRDTQLHERPDPASPTSPAAVFGFWYVLAPDPGGETRRLSELGSATRDGFYRVASGEAEREFRGWISAKAVAVWRRGQALRPAPREGREPVSFYASEEAALRALETGDGRSATHREPAASESALLLPILETRERRAGREKLRLYKVALVTAKPGSPPTGSPTSPAEVLAKTTLDLVFVIDTTSSMTDPIRQVAKSITQVTYDLSGRPHLRGRVRFGLVGFRDTIDGVRPGPLHYVAKSFCDLQEGTDHRAFRRHLISLKVTNESSEDIPEDVLAGLAVAMDEERLGWNPLAWRHIVVVGDSSIKNPDHPDADSRKNFGGMTLEWVRNRARKEPVGGIPDTDGFVISAVRIRQLLHPEDYTLGNRQFESLIDGRHHHGKLVKARGDATEDFSAELTAALLESIDTFETDLLRRVPEEKDASNLAIRYCTDVDAGGRRTLLPQRLVRRGRLDSFIAFLALVEGLLEESGEPGTRDMETFVYQLREMSVTLGFDTPVTADSGLDHLFSGILGLPVRARSFQLTVGELAAMKSSRFQKWLHSINGVRSGLKKVVERPELWFKLHPEAPERDRHAFIDESALP